MEIDPAFTSAGIKQNSAPSGLFIWRVVVWKYSYFESCVNWPFPNYAPLPTNRNIKSRPSAKSTANV